MWRKDKEAPWWGYQNAENFEQTTCSAKLGQGKAFHDPRMNTISVQLPVWSTSHIDLPGNRCGSLSCTPGVLATWIRLIEAASGLKVQWWIPSTDPSTREENLSKGEPPMGVNLRSLLIWYSVYSSSVDLHISGMLCGWICLHKYVLCAA